MQYHTPKVNKSNVGPCIRYAVDFWDSDYQLTRHGISEVRGLLQKYLPVMKEQEFRGLAPSHIEFSIRSEYADELITRLGQLIRDLYVLEHLPITKSEIEAYLNFIILGEKQCAEAAQRSSAISQDASEENNLGRVATLVI